MIVKNTVGKIKKEIVITPKELREIVLLAYDDDIDSNMQNNIVHFLELIFKI